VAELAADHAEPADDAWEDTTAETLGYLADLRREHRRQRIGSAAYVGYVVVLFGGIYGAPYVLATLSAPVPAAAAAARTGAVVACAAAAVLSACLVALVRDGGWRGPALLDPATTVWVLTAPVRVGALLRPRLRVTLATAAVVGAVTGAAVGLEVHVLAGGASGDLAAAGAAALAVTAVLGTAIAAFVEQGRARVARWGGSPRGAALWLVPAGLAVLTVWLGTGGGSSAVADTVGRAALWSGPWGWAAQPLVAATPSGRRLAGGPGSGEPWLVLAAAVAAVAATLADRRIDGVPARVLRARAQTVAVVSAAAYTLQPRMARLAVQSAAGWTPGRGVRLPMPQRPAMLAASLLVPWRDLTGLLRMPSRLFWGLAWAGLALWLNGAAAGALPAFGVLVATYLAAAQLVEPARLDADDPRRMRITPASGSRLALLHAAVPLVLLLVICAGWLAGSAGLGSGGWSAGPLGSGWRSARAWLVVLAVPGLVGAALVSAFRGWAPSSGLSGAPTAFGDPGPAGTLLWYARGPIAALVLLTPLAIGRGDPVTWAVVAAGVMLQWAARRGDKIVHG
jgi:hypothetical protein